jgi:hypothetical protein
MNIRRRVRRMITGEKEFKLTFQSPAEPPRLALDGVETRMNMGQFNGLFKDPTSPDRLPNGLQKMHSSPILPSGWWIIPPIEEMERG